MKIKPWYILLLAIPAAGALWYLNTYTAYHGQFDIWVFALALISLIPLAQLSGDVVETLTNYISPLAQGLLDASLSNVPELAIGVFLILHALVFPQTQVENYEIVQGLLIGSVINNVLFTLGFSTFISAFRHGRLTFNKERAAGYASMLALAVVGLALPTLATKFSTLSGSALANADTAVSLVVGGILIVSYIAYVGADIFKWGERKQNAAVAVGEASAEHHADHHAEHAEHEGPMTVAQLERMAKEKLEAEAERLEQAAQKTRQELRLKNRPLFLLAALSFAIVTIITVGVCFMLVSVTDTVISGTPLTPLSTGLILFPIICNFGEIIEAVQKGWGRDMEGAMEIAAGSSVQIPLFVTPLLVFVGYFLSLTGLIPPLTLIFQPLELIVIGLVTFVYALVNLDGETTWLEGAQLLAFYVMIAVTAFALPGQ
ncbi:MAG TPA: hypothetical protein VMV29_15605 [Ktedonobacterales bacterium]|nr:hypothetical protein [Ktedonobacterales bacterium]